MLTQSQAQHKQQEAHYKRQTMLHEQGAISEAEFEQALAAFQQETPLGKLVTPEQVADAVCYLAEAHMVTGQILSVDGGIVI